MNAAEHRIHIFFDFQFSGHHGAPSIKRVTMGQVDGTFIDASRLEDGVERPIAAHPVWQDDPRPVSPDLHANVREILGRRLRLSANAQALAKGRYRAPYGSRGVHSLACIAPNREIALEIEDIELHLFGPRIGLAIVTIICTGSHARAATLEDIAIATRLMCNEFRDAPLGWRESEDAPPRDRFRLSDFVSALIAPAGAQISDRGRRYSYVGATFDETVDADVVREAAFRLSRHYDQTYLPTAEFEATEFIQPFRTVTHALSREGAATLVHGLRDAKGDEVAYLRLWINQPHSHVYLPLQIIAYHEHVALLDLAQGSKPNSAAGHAAAKDASMQHAHEWHGRFLAFRFQYRLTQVSAISMHDSVYAATTRALGVPDLNEKVSRDLPAIVQEMLHEREREAKRKEDEETKKSAAFYAWGGFGLFYLATSNVLTHLTDGLHPLLNPLGHALTLNPGAIKITGDAVIQVVALFVGGIGGWLTHKKAMRGVSSHPEIVSDVAADLATP